ncbi:hypothetical protein M409DRAFT_18919 [Zasmidium cellare ATCC 36951]|uniref:Uncharacterized protein n=1 Tax=Zasmidium cellare ATCC 36951 TaxID=1080233 RepID=A0A6A6CYR1_ZASCE|nr:uncharacterized protein M409DRAFT_18919 [Zasmidium cellare ATCC 36951]KAF2170949.1 hypothetical protein M409DRAFT_18919 [Zasmidium cellare ATCC 36951]
MAFPKINYRYTCTACTLYDSDAAAEDEEEHISRAEEHIIYLCRVCKKSSCTAETLSSHFDDKDSNKECQRFKWHSILTIQLSSVMQVLRTSNAPTSGIKIHREVVTAADHLAKQREALLRMHPELNSSLLMPRTE